MKRQLFIVEDHPAMRDAYTLTINAEPDLTICGSASTAEHALSEINRLHPDLVLVDISLPGMSGIEFLRSLQAQRPDLPALIISGHDKAVYNSAPANTKGFVMKHEGPDVLLAAIRRIFRNAVVST